MANRYFVQVDARTKIPTVYINDEGLLRRKDVFEIPEKEVITFQTMSAQGRPLGDHETRFTDRSVKEKLAVQSALPADTGVESNPVLENPTLEAPKEALTPGGEPIVRDQESLYLADVDAINLMNTAAAIEEYMLRKYRVDIPHTTKAQVRRESILKLRDLRANSKLF